MNQFNSNNGIVVVLIEHDQYMKYDNIRIRPKTDIKLDRFIRYHIVELFINALTITSLIYWLCSEFCMATMSMNECWTTREERKKKQNV